MSHTCLFCFTCLSMIKCVIKQISLQDKLTVTCWQWAVVSPPWHKLPFLLIYCLTDVKAFLQPARFFLSLVYVIRNIVPVIYGRFTYLRVGIAACLWLWRVGGVGWGGVGVALVVLVSWNHYPRKTQPSRLRLWHTPTASLQRGKTAHPPSNECPGYDIKQSDGEAPVMLELWGMWSTPLLLSLPGPLWPKVVAPNRVWSMGWIELFDI